METHPYFGLLHVFWLADCTFADILDTWISNWTGCRVSNLEGWDATCSHLVIDLSSKAKTVGKLPKAKETRLPRTEKFLCALAAGQPVLTDGYVKACAAAGSLLDESPYECRKLYPQVRALFFCICS